ncbi:MAG TPA: ABC transporter substrate-binding protein [Thermoanaerobaculia bacterium]|nr:ABC transporter substrate-binding protein [Thermoanaerobaculia bacterium]
MRRTLVVLLIVLALVTCAPQRVEQAEPPAKPLRIGRYCWPGLYWVDIAAAKGWFAEEGLPVELIDTNADYYGSIAAVAGGTLDVHGFYVFDLVLFNARGSDLVGFLTSDVDTGATGIVVKREIGNLPALCGRKVAVPRGTFCEFLLSAALERQGMSLRDVELIDAPAESAPASLARPEIAGVVTWEPILSDLLRQGYVGAFGTGDLPGVAPSVIATRRDVLRERPDDLMKLCRVWRKTTSFIENNPQAAFAIVARTYGRTPEEVAEFARHDRIRGLADNLAAFTYGPGFDSLYGAVESVNRHLVDSGAIGKPIDTAGVLDQRFVRLLRRETSRQ